MTVDQRLERVVRAEQQAFGRLAAPPRRERSDHQQPLTAGEEIGLAERIGQGDLAARQEMIERNLGLVHALAKPYRHRGVPYADLVQEGTIGLVHTLAKPYRHRGVPYADLVQEGTIGLIRAVGGFDHRRGFKFSTYAVWWIRRSLLDAIGAARPIRIPAHAAHQLSVVRRAEQELEEAGVRLASAEAVAAQTGLSASNVWALRAAPRVTASLDESAGERARPLSEVIGDPHGTEPDDDIARDEMRQEVWQQLRLLPERHRHVLIRRYGIGGGRPESHREIGERLGVKEERSRQLEREALHRLRELLTSRQDVA